MSVVGDNAAIMAAGRRSVWGACGITAGDLARWLSVDLKTVHNWVRRGKLAGRRTEGGHRRFFRSEVVRFLRRLGRHVPKPLADFPVATGRLQLGSSSVVPGAERQSRVASALVQAALEAADGRFEILVLETDEAEPENAIEVLRALRSHHLTRGLAIVVVSRDVGFHQRFVEAGGDVSVRCEHEVGAAVAWLSGAPDGLAPGTVAEASLHSGVDIAVHEASALCSRISLPLASTR